MVVKGSRNNRRTIEFKKFFSSGVEKFIKCFTTNSRVKVGILGFAVILWFFTVLGNRYTYTFDVSLEVMNIESGKTLKEKIPEDIQASFSGRGLDLFFLMLSSKSSFKFILDLNTIRQFYDFPLKEYFSEDPEKVVYPRKKYVTFEQIVWPDTVHVELDRFVEVRVPIISQVKVEESAGYIEIESQKLVPDSVTISGPRTYVRKYKSIKTEEYFRADVSAPFEITLSLDLPESENIKISQKKVRVYQNVEQIGEEIFSNIPVDVINVPRGLRVEVSPSSVSLKVSSGVDFLKSLKPEDFRVYFDFSSNWRPNQSVYSPSITLPEKVLPHSEITPRKLEIRVIRERMQ